MKSLIRSLIERPPDDMVVVPPSAAGAGLEEPNRFVPAHAATIGASSPSATNPGTRRRNAPPAEPRVIIPVRLS
jgi:hypothetical protein